MPRAKITSKGQVTIPVEVREALGVKQGDVLAFETKAEYVVVRRVPTAAEVYEQFEKEGWLRPLPEGMTEDDMIAAYFDEWEDHSGTTAYLARARRRVDR